MVKDGKPSDFSARWFVENSDKNGNVETTGRTFTITRPNAKFFGVCAGNQELDLQSSKLPVDESVGVFPFIEVKTVKGSKECIILLAGGPLQISEKNPEIEIRKKNDGWEIEVSKDSKYLRLNVFDRGLVPEFEIVELRCD